MDKVLITGGAGFIGSHLAEYLISKKKKLYLIDNLSNGNLRNIKKFKTKIKFFKIDIRNKIKLEKFFKNNKIDTIFHLAALADIVPSIENPKLYYDVNVSGTMNLLECAKKFKVNKFIYAASSSCYGIPKKYPTSENAKIDTQYPYALTKFLGEELVLHYGRVFKLQVTSMRLFNVYGPRSRTSGTYGAVFGVFLKQKIKEIPFTVVGDGNQTRDFTFVSDVAEAFYKAAKKKTSGQIFNIGSGKSISINQIVRLLKGSKIHIPKRPGEPDKTFANINKIKKNLNWHPKINIQTGIKILLDNISYWKDAPLWTPKKIKIATRTWFKYLK